MLATEKNIRNVPDMKCDDTTIYHVKSQDTLCRIAVNHNTTTSNLMKLNKLTSTLIFPGQVLIVPHNTEEDDVNGSSNGDLPCPIATTIDDAYAFLSPLSVGSYNKNTNSLQAPLKPFKDLTVTSDKKQENNLAEKMKKIAVAAENVIECNSLHIDSNVVKKSAIPLVSEDLSSKQNGTSRRRTISIDSCLSEPFEENFLKLNVHYLTAVLEHVHGILLITPTSIMFDPDPTCPLALEHGCEKFGVMIDLKHIITLTMYRDTGYIRENEIEQKQKVDEARSRPPYSENMNRSNKQSSRPSSVDTSNDFAASSDENATTSNDPTVPIDHDMLHSSAPTSDTFALENDFVTVSVSETAGRDGLKEMKVTDNRAMISQVSAKLATSESAQDAIDEATISLSNSDEENFMYFCVRSNQPIMKTFSVLSALNDSNEEVNPQEEVNDAWFHVPRRNSDQVMAFFMQWSPDPYALDFVEQNGFVMAETLEVRKKVKKQKKKRKDVEVRSRSSTMSTSSSASSMQSSLEQSTEEFVGNRKVEKEWELVGIEEAKRRNEINAYELANDDTSLIPELRHTSNLINDDTLLELCKRMPARCIGCPWRLLYSTSEHGMSLRTLYRKMKNCCKDEDSPAFIIVRDTEGYIFGAFSSSRPRVNEHFYGSGESFLFTLEPQVEFFEWSGDNNFFIKGDSDALVFGGGDGSAGLWIDGDLRQGRSRACLTYSNKVLSSSEDFLIQDVEIWGFDGFDQC